ncbi:major facilitator superfamily domain-containing protein [Parasitella parasitica]|nr:major facilitator superfamily domain-containing protein [Parasitella parasitica]
MAAPIRKDPLSILSIDEKKSLKDQLKKSRLFSCFAGAVVLFASFGIRQTIGVFLVPITQSTGWDRSTFSIAAGIFQLFWGFSQPFLVYLAERKFGFGKSIFAGCLCYSLGLLIVYASPVSSGLFIFAYGIIVGTAAANASFPVVLASIGQRFAQKSKEQAIAFGIVSSFGSLGQVVFLPVAREMVVAMDWRLSFIVLGVFMGVISPLAYFLQTIPPPKPAKPTVLGEIEKLDTTNYNEKDQEQYLESQLEQKGIDKIVESCEAPNIKSALKQAFTSPTFLMITLGFSVCGFHVTFLATHFPAYLQDQGIDPSLAAWTISILGAGSMIGSISAGYITSYISPRITLTFVYLLRAILIAIFVFLPTTTTTAIVFSCLFGFLWLSTVPVTTKFIGDVFGHKFLGTLTSVSFAGHQIGSFLGAYLGGVVVDVQRSYTSMWYGSLALALLAVIANFFAEGLPRFERRK